MATTLDEATIARDANRRIRRSDNITGWAFAGPSVFIVLGLSFIPMIWAAYLSLTDSNLLSHGSFIGFANYAALAKDPMLRQAFTIPKSGSKMNPNSRPSAAADATNGTRKQVR